MIVDDMGQRINQFQEQLTRAAGAAKPSTKAGESIGFDPARRVREARDLVIQREAVLAGFEIARGLAREELRELMKEARVEELEDPQDRLAVAGMEYGSLCVQRSDADDRRHEAWEKYNQALAELSHRERLEWWMKMGLLHAKEAQACGLAGDAAPSR